MNIMSIKFKHIIYTKQLSREDCKNCLGEIIAILKANQVPEIEILFGFAWGNDYKDWMPFLVSTDEIMIEIDTAEKSGAGSFSMMRPLFTCHNLTVKYFFVMNMTST